MRRRLPIALGAFGLLAACTNSDLLVDPEIETAASDSPDLTAIGVPCEADIAALTIQCGPVPDLPSGALGDLTLGGQGVFIQLASTNVNYDPLGEILTADVSLQNLIGQAIGTLDGSTTTAISVFFDQLPAVTAGSGVVTVNNGDGIGTFTAPNQVFFEYDELLTPNGTSTAKTWEFEVPTTAISFQFTVFVQAPVQYQNGWVDLSGNDGEPVAIGTAFVLNADVFDPVGTPAGQAVSYGSSNDNVATVDGAGNVSVVGQGTVTITATSAGPEASASATFTTYQLLTAGTAITGLSALTGENQFFALPVPANTETIGFTLQGGTGDADLYVSFDVLPTFAVSDCASLTGTNVESCLFDNPADGLWFVMVNAFNTIDGVDIQAHQLALTTTFDIELLYVSAATASQQQIFATAEARWEAIITNNLARISLLNFNTTIFSNICGGSVDPEINQIVDDVLIIVELVLIDGPGDENGNILGQAGPCLVRTAGDLPLLGIMRFDTYDIANLEAAGSLQAVILHEMGHVIGIGTIWQRPNIDLLVGAGTADPYFTGPEAIQAFTDIGGPTVYVGNPVPVENTGGAGTANSHWREVVFDNELMTGFLDAGSNPLSIQTIESLEDLGYAVDPAQADAFSLIPGPGPARAAPESGIELNDVWPIPLFRLLDDGTMVAVETGQTFRLFPSEAGAAPKR